MKALLTNTTKELFHYMRKVCYFNNLFVSYLIKYTAIDHSLYSDKIIDYSTLNRCAL